MHLVTLHQLSRWRWELTPFSLQPCLYYKMLVREELNSITDQPCLQITWLPKMHFSWTPLWANIHPEWKVRWWSMKERLWSEFHPSGQIWPFTIAVPIVHKSFAPGKIWRNTLALSPKMLYAALLVIMWRRQKSKWLLIWQVFALNPSQPFAIIAMLALEKGRAFALTQTRSFGRKFVRSLKEILYSG